MDFSSRLPRPGGSLPSDPDPVPRLPAPPWAADLAPEDLEVDLWTEEQDSATSAETPLSYRDDVSGVEAALLRAELLRELREVQRGA